MLSLKMLYFFMRKNVFEFILPVSGTLQPKENNNKAEVEKVKLFHELLNNLN